VRSWLGSHSALSVISVVPSPINELKGELPSTPRVPGTDAF